MTDIENENGMSPPHKLGSKLPKETTPKFLSPLLERLLLFPFPCVLDGNQDYRVVPLKNVYRIRFFLQIRFFLNPNQNFFYDFAAKIYF